MAMVADDSGNEIKTVQDVLKSEGNDELKFGLLIGLIKLKQVSNKDVVDTLLHLVSASPTDVVCIYISVHKVQPLPCHSWPRDVFIHRY